MSGTASRREFRGAALAAVALLSGSYLSVLYHVADVVGDTTALLLLVVGSAGLATFVGRHVPAWAALGIATALVGGGVAVYFYSVPEKQIAALTVGRLLGDALALLTGLSVLRLTEAGTWALAVTPTPVFLSWYLAMRRRYAASAAVGGAALGLFVLTGDADVVTTLAGVAGATGAVAFGTFERRGGTVAQLETFIVVVAAMIVLASTVSVFPGSAATPITPDRGSSTTVESSLVESQDSIAVLGSIRLSPQVRFTVRGAEANYWQTGAYDRYTGSGWVRTGDAKPYEGRLSGPPGDARTVEQSVTARMPMRGLPAAWKPVALDGPVTSSAERTPQGILRTTESVKPGDTFTVTSRIPQYTEADLRSARTDYPDTVERRYMQVPDSTTDRVRERAADVTADADTPYEKAEAIERHLESEKEYSLTVRQPRGDIADQFLFEMERGYCVYYATTMVVMLRSVGVPARFAVGYTQGEEAQNGQYVVRGLDSHAWVQVYFPDVGWVNFDPTPADPRQEAEAARLNESQPTGPSDARPDVDNETSTETPTETPTPTQTPNGTDATAERTTAASTPGSRGDGVELPEIPPWKTLAVWAVALVGAVAGARRSGASKRLYRTASRHYQGPRRDPSTDVERAFARLETHLARRYRPRRTGETARAYVERLRAHGADERALDVLRAYERARYGAEVTSDTADDAVETVDAIVRESTPLVDRFHENRE